MHIDARGMASEPSRWGDDGVFDPATAVGLQNHHHVLVLGNPAFMPWLTRENENIAQARKINEAVKIVQLDDFDRVIVGREYDLSHWTGLAIAHAALNARQGVLVYFPKNEGEAWTFKQNIDFAFPLSHIWETNTTFGQMIQVDLRGEHIHA